jgi:lipopolysaccharide export system permease protein
VAPAGAAEGFTGAYPAANKLCATVLYGICVGFVVYLVTVLACRLGQAGAMGPAAAAQWAVPAVIGVGLTELLSKEDGRT